MLSYASEAKGGTVAREARRKKRRMDHRVINYFDKAFKWSIAAMCEKDGDFPVVKGCHVVPKCLVSFLKAKKKRWNGAFLHFFHSDYLFDGARGIWFDTLRHLAELERFRGVLSPDFSMYPEAGRIPNLWNTYRNRLMQCHLERLGLLVIPTVSWADQTTYDFCFRGIPRHSVVAVSSLGVMGTAEKRRAFEAGYSKMCETLQPESVVLYGSDRNLSLGETPHRCFRNGTYDWTDLTAQCRKEA